MRSTNESPGELTRRFYRLRASNDLTAVRAMIVEDFIWIEPEVGDHMGRMIGADAVIDMIERARAKTGGTFSLSVAKTMETASHCVALIDWRAEKSGTLIEGREIAVYGFRDGLIVSANFFPENIVDDQVF